MPRGTFIGAPLAVSVLGGMWAGSDAARQTDTYPFVPVRAKTPGDVTVARVPSRPEWPEAAVPAALPSGSRWRQNIGRDERAFFDLGPIADEPPARVHRLRADRSEGDVADAGFAELATEAEVSL